MCISLVMRLAMSVEVSTFLFWILGRVCYFWSHRVINNLQGSGFSGYQLQNLRLEIIPLLWLDKTFGVLKKMTLFWMFMCLPQNPNEILLMQCLMSYHIGNLKWESSMQRSQLNADWRLTLPSQLCSEGLSLLQEFLCHVGRSLP